MRHTLFVLILAIVLPARAQHADYRPADSIKIVQLLQSARRQNAAPNPILYFARQLRGIPYAAKTLERNKEEQLVVNLRQLDCTTYVENVLALYLCHKNDQTTFSDFCRHLQHIRYADGRIDYPHRLHYFSHWLEHNTRLGHISRIREVDPPFSAQRLLALRYMTAHPHLYPMMNGNDSIIGRIRETEQRLSGQPCRYIPKDSLRNTPLLRRTIHNGDIIAIQTNRPGLDTSHVGIAVWHADGLHLLNASTVHRQVVEERLTLQAYMRRHPSQIGISVARIH